MSSNQLSDGYATGEHSRRDILVWSVDWVLRNQAPHYRTDSLSGEVWEGWWPVRPRSWRFRGHFGLTVAAILAVLLIAAVLAVPLVVFLRAEAAT